MKDKYFGVVEGFYRRAYTFPQRLDLINFLSELGLNTYVYGPKADPFHRKKWYQAYPSEWLKKFERLNQLCTKSSINFIFALSPMFKSNKDVIIKKFNTFLDIGVKGFSLFYDDINVPLVKETAEIQVETANQLYDYLSRKMSRPILFFCPTQYRGFEKTEYISTIADRLSKNIQIFWTGKSVVAKKITEIDIDRITQIIKRKPLIWDNIFANDYLPSKIWRFPYRRREPGMLNKVTGILVNPMNNYPASKPLIFTAAAFFKDPFNYNARQAWKEANELLKG